jgi:hypothetical protein
LNFVYFNFLYTSPTGISSTLTTELYGNYTQTNPIHIPYSSYYVNTPEINETRKSANIMFNDIINIPSVTVGTDPINSLTCELFVLSGNHKYKIDANCSLSVHSAV